MRFSRLASGDRHCSQPHGRIHTTWRPELLSAGLSVSPESLTAGLWLPSLAPDVSRGSLDQLKSGVRQPPTQTLLPGVLCSQSAQAEHSQPPTALQGICCHLPAGAPCPPLRSNYPAYMMKTESLPGGLFHSSCLTIGNRDSRPASTAERIGAEPALRTSARTAASSREPGDTRTRAPSARPAGPGLGGPSRGGDCPGLARLGPSGSPDGP
ncbi:unnamed protein product [Rangifer tarandus platyrhynchus]|uniref:Uncharacterized protein n=1 Tax=Rangifer tarandus platyrhynchus TaxID=3082113 RepID=A0ABN8YW68_RANTA|nr:unnamed protein product [Rangifer tarandus platyrhynchus]